VGVVYGRVKLKFKSSKAVVEPSRSSSEAQAPADAGKSQAAAPEASKQVTAAEKSVAASSDGQTADGQASESSGSDKDKVAKKVGSIKIVSVGLSSSAQDSAQDRKADEVVDEPIASKQEIVLVNDESDNASEPRGSQESDVKQSALERQRDEKELAAALEVSTI
jgi:hypothetical protein